MGLGLGPVEVPGSEFGAGSAARFEARLAQVRVDDRVEEGEGVLVLDRVRVGARVRVTLTLTLALALALALALTLARPPGRWSGNLTLPA